MTIANNLQSLLLATFYNYYGPEYWYTLFSSNFAGWGDKDTFPMALKAVKESYHLITHPIVTVFQVPNNRTPPAFGIGMAQADPRNETVHRALFMHCNIIKWSMRQFLCEGCTDIWNQDSDRKFISRYENPEDGLYENLHEGKRVLESHQLDEQGLDPEPNLWKSIEYAACRSKAWGNTQACRNAREYMTKTFGFSFELPPNKASGAASMTDYCLVEPASEQRP
jgi:alpha 1,2-mannosyltransferase